MFIPNEWEESLRGENYILLDPKYHSLFGSKHRYCLLKKTLQALHVLHGKIFLFAATLRSKHNIDKNERTVPDFQEGKAQNGKISRYM